MAKDKKDSTLAVSNREGGMTLQEATEQLDKLRKSAKPLTNGFLSPEYGMFFVSARGPFDIHDTVIAIPLPYLVQAVGAFMGSGIAQLLSQIEAKPLDKAPGAVN